jgi:hypothetical protein
MALSRRQTIKIVSSIFAFIGALLIAIVGWHVSKDFRMATFKDATHKISIQYPAAWKKSTEFEGVTAMFISPKENDLDFFQENVNIVVKEDTSERPQTIEQFKEVMIRLLVMTFGDTVQIVEEGQAQMAGLSGYKIVYLGKSPEAELKFMMVWVNDGIKIYQFTYSALSSKFDQYLDKVNRMMASFKIL